MRYRKKPLEIEAYELIFPMTDQPDWLRDAFETGDVYYQGGHKPYLTIEQTKGVQRRAYEGDFILCAPHGELIPCKPDVFHTAYEPVTD